MHITLKHVFCVYPAVLWPSELEHRLEITGELAKELVAAMVADCHDQGLMPRDDF